MIKSNGGVFGRNPTFNDVTVEGNLTVNGDLALGDDITINDTLTVNGAATFKGGITSIPNAAADTSNVALGNQAGNALASGGINNVMVGELAGRSVTTGDDNVAIGRRAMINSSSTASANVMIGSFTGANVTGDRNVGIGSEYSINGAATFNLLTSGAQNVAVGARTSVNLTTGSNTTAVGYEALRLNTASDVTAVGANALDANTTGANNTAVGKDALGANTTGNSNTALGFGAGANVTTASDTVAVGTNAAQAGNIGSATAIGTTALLNATTATGTVAIGARAGRYAGTTATNMTSGSNSIFIGYLSRPAADSQTNQIVIGNDAVGSGSNTTTIGNSSTTDTIIPAGRLGVGATTLPDGPIHVTGSSSSTSAYNVGSQIAVLTNASATNNNWANISFTDEDGGAAAGVFGLQYLDHANKYGRFLLATRSSGGLTEKLTVESAGDVKITTGNLVIGTAGKGIDFSADAHATGMTSELLDDYEEGTFTPVVRGSTTAGTYELSTSEGRYTKIGRQVTVLINVVISAAVTGGGAGNFEIAGLPFTAAAAPQAVGPFLLYHFGVAGSKDYSNMTISANATHLSAAAGSLGVDGTQASISITAVGASDYIRITAIYFVD